MRDLCNEFVVTDFFCKINSASLGENLYRCCSSVISVLFAISGHTSTYGKVSVFDYNCDRPRFQTVNLFTWRHSHGLVTLRNLCEIIQFVTFNGQLT